MRLPQVRSRRARARARASTRARAACARYEISILLLFAYGSYALGEAIELSGIMALFFCGIVLAHYNSYNLSKTSQVTAHEVFESLACLSETFVFMFMGMGFFTGRFSEVGSRFDVS